MNNSGQLNNDIIRRIREKIRKITNEWEYKYAIISRTKKSDHDLNQFWVDLYISHTAPPAEEVKKAESIKDLEKYNLEYVCTETAKTLVQAYLNLLRHIEILDNNVKYLQHKKKQQNNLDKN